MTEVSPLIGGSLPTTMKMGVGPEKGDFSVPGSIEWQDVPVPEVKDDLVLIQVKAVAMNRVDVLRAGGSSGQQFPIKPLTDVSGVVVAKGPNCTNPNLKMGDQVVVCVYPRDNGGECLAEYMVAKEAWVGPKPAAWNHGQSAAIAMTACTANTCLEKAAPLDSSTEIVLVGASGGVGAMIMGLNRPNASPILAVASSSKHALCKNVGGPTVQVLDYKKEDWADRYKDSAPYAVIDVSSASPADSYYKACDVGAEKFLTTNTVDPSFMCSCSCLCTELCFQCKAKICNCCCGRPSYSLVLLNKENGSDLFKTCASLAQQGVLAPPPIQLFPPAQVHMAYGMMNNASGKAVIDMSRGV